MSPERLENLFKNRSRLTISLSERLVFTLSFLAKGDSQQSQSFNFRVIRATVCHITMEICKVIRHNLSEIYLTAPEKMEDWKKIATRFEKEWNFPTCIGALDGKYVAIDCQTIVILLLLLQAWS